MTEREKRGDFGRPSNSALEDVWRREATRVAIEAARKVIKDGVIPPGTPIGRLSITEWGWVVAAVLFGWITTRVQQAISEEVDTESVLRTTSLDPEPWDAGVILSVLPDLAETPGIDWTLPLAQWSRDAVVHFLLTAIRLIRRDEIARDQSDRGLTGKPTASVVAREAHAPAGGPLMTLDVLNDEIPF
jgi:hypothetical protein